MAVVKNEYPVNSGNIGWTRSDVISAMENAFSGLDGGAGWHSGTAKTGVPVSCFAPGSSVPYAVTNGSNNWRYAAAAVTTQNPIASRYFNVTNSGSGGYNWEQEWAQDIYFYNDSQSGLESAVRLYDHELNTGDEIVFDLNAYTGSLPTGITDGQTYYVISIGNEDWVQLATTSANATNGVRIDFGTSNYSVGSNQVFFKKSIGTNPTIVCRQRDRLYITVNASGHPFYVQDQVGAFNTNRVLNTTNYVSHSYRDFPVNQGIETGTFTWEIDNWPQGDYYYICQLHSSMNGIIRVLPSTASYGYGDSKPYWDYTVPGASVGAGRTDLQLRITRQISPFDSYVGHVWSIEILNEATGWQDNDVFTIPGGSIGGASPANDITFGVNSSTTQQNNTQSAIPNIRVTDIGGDGNGGFYQKLGTSTQPGAILRIENDSNKTYGHTYYGFRITSDYHIQISSGSQWNYLNYDPTSATLSYNGTYGGERGLDYSNVFGTPPSLSDNSTHYKEFSFTTSTTSTSYPLKIVTYQAQSPQDTNFVVVNFVYTINGNDFPVLSFTPLKGTNIGNGIWDLNNVWTGMYLTYQNAGNETLDVVLNAPNAEYVSDEEDQGTAIRREAFYGYYRDAAIYYSDRFTSSYTNNIFKAIGDNTANITGYYRNSTYDDYTVNEQSTTWFNKNDAIQTYSVDSGADFYRPFKGLPINQNMMPCPYYLPDDYTMIQFAVTPGATSFSTGDTITVSGSEIYEIIQVSYSTNQLGLDDIASNTSKGIAFCARTT